MDHMDILEGKNRSKHQDFGKGVGVSGWSPKLTNIHTHTRHFYAVSLETCFLPSEDVYHFRAKCNDFFSKSAVGVAPVFQDDFSTSIGGPMSVSPMG